MEINLGASAKPSFPVILLVGFFIFNRTSCKFLAAEAAAQIVSSDKFAREHVHNKVRFLRSAQFSS